MRLIRRRRQRRSPGRSRRSPRAGQGRRLLPRFRAGRSPQCSPRLPPRSTEPAFPRSSTPRLVASSTPHTVGRPSAAHTTGRRAARSATWGAHRPGSRSWFSETPTPRCGCPQFSVWRRRMGGTLFRSRSPRAPPRSGTTGTIGASATSGTSGPSGKPRPCSPT